MLHESWLDDVRAMVGFFETELSWTATGICRVDCPRAEEGEYLDALMVYSRGSLVSRTFLVLGSEGACYLDLNRRGRVTDFRFFRWEEISKITVREKTRGHVLQFKCHGEVVQFTCLDFSPDRSGSGVFGELLTQAVSVTRSFRWTALRNRIVRRRGGRFFSSTGEPLFALRQRVLTGVSAA